MYEDVFEMQCVSQLGPLKQDPPRRRGRKVQQEAGAATYAAKTISSDGRKEPDMSTERQNAQNYIARQTNDVYFEGSGKLQVKFGLADSKPPKNGTELVARIQAGQYVLENTEYDDYEDPWNYNPLAGVRWRDPSVKEDKDGFKAAEKLLDGQKQTVVDANQVLDPAVALDALNGLRAYVATL